jgi:hypothetical protein
MTDSDISNPIEYPFMPGELGEQHHADEKEIDVRSLTYSADCAAHGDEPRRSKEKRACSNPHRFRDAPGPEEHAKDAGERDEPDEKNVRPEEVHSDWESRLLFTGV